MTRSTFPAILADADADADDIEQNLHTVELLLESNRTGSRHCCPHSDQNHDDVDDNDDRGGNGDG